MAVQKTAVWTKKRPQMVASRSERECLARAMYFESNRSSTEGMLAVGSVVMNRVEAAHGGTNICGVVGAPRQFAPGVLTRSMTEPQSRARAMAVADEILSGQRHAKVGDARYFHMAGLKFNYPNMNYVTVAGGNAFYHRGKTAPIQMAIYQQPQQSFTPAPVTTASAYVAPAAPAPTMTAFSQDNGFTAPMRPGAVIVDMDRAARTAAAETNTLVAPARQQSSTIAPVSVDAFQLAPLPPRRPSQLGMAKPDQHAATAPSSAEPVRLAISSTNVAR
ncbi:cell wall hydrolase [Microvirga sp. W0021]|uniref:Cell wall hydrolase n=2 Tax=Hohaiivirga grylli TaxID=3133970 RepID=A0ABV0BHQ3_9HYPH